jgi:hypothetical protein
MSYKKLKGAKENNSSSLKFIGERRLPFFLTKRLSHHKNHGILSRKKIGNTTKIDLVT